MGRLQNEKDLIGKLKEDIENTNRSSVVIVGGHLPLLYEDRDAETDGVFASASLGVDRWGVFSPYTFNLACELTAYVFETGRTAKISVIVDDHVEKLNLEPKYQSARRRFFKNQTDLPFKYQESLNANGLDFSVLSTINYHGIETPLISELWLRRQAEKSGLVASNTCSKSYRGFLNASGLFDIKSDYLISFIPGQCKGNICEGVLEQFDKDNIDKDNIKFLSSHVFFPHIIHMGGLKKTKLGYRKLHTPWTKKQLFDFPSRVDLERTD